jgi:hypothetical protein
VKQLYHCQIICIVLNNLVKFVASSSSVMSTYIRANILLIVVWNIALITVLEFFGIKRSIAFSGIRKHSKSIYCVFRKILYETTQCFCTVHSPIQSYGKLAKLLPFFNIQQVLDAFQLHL